MAQYLRPNNDDANSGWVQSTGSYLYTTIDETSYDDADYMRSDTQGEQCDIGLTTVTDPGVGTGHTVRIRHKATGSGGGEKMSVNLREGTNVRATILNNATIARSWSTTTYNLTEAEANSIVNYADLYLRFYVGTLGASETIDVSWVEMEVPDASSTLTVNDAYCTCQADDTLKTTKNTSITGLADAYCTSQVDAVVLTGISTSITVNDASCTSQTDNVTTTKQTSLTVNDASCTSQVDVVSLSVVSVTNLVVADAGCPCQADNVVTTKQTSLTVNDASCVSQTDTLKTTKQTSLTVADAYCTSQTDAVVITEVIPWYRPDTLTVNVGSINTGTLRNVWVADDSELILNETVANPGFDYIFRFGRDQDVPSTNIKIVLQAWYEGNPAHPVELMQYSYVDLMFYYINETVKDIPDSDSEQNYEFNLVNDPDFISSGEIQVKIIHDAFGAGVGHYLHIDHMYIDYATPSVTVADAHCTSQADNVTLVQVHNLVVQDASCVSQVDTLVVSSIPLLVVSDAYCISQVDTLITTKNTSIVVADAYCTSQADATSLQDNSLIVEDAYSESYIGFLLLLENVTLSVNDVYSTSQVDTVATDSGTPLYVGDAYCRSIVEVFTKLGVLPHSAGPITQVHNLTVNDTYSTSQVDTPSLAKETTLSLGSGAGAYCTSQVDTVVGTRQYNIYPDDARCQPFVEPFVKFGFGFYAGPITITYNLVVDDAYCSSFADATAVWYRTNLSVRDSHCTSYASPIVIFQLVPGIITEPCRVYDVMDEIRTFDVEYETRTMDVRNEIRELEVDCP